MEALAVLPRLLQRPAPDRQGALYLTERQRSVWNGWPVRHKLESAVMKAIDKPACREWVCSPDCPGTRTSLPAFIKPFCMIARWGR